MKLPVLIASLFASSLFALAAEEQQIASTNSIAETNLISAVDSERSLSHPAAEVVKLADSGAASTVILAYINNASEVFRLSADDVIYLRDLGVSSEFITAMLDRDVVLRANSEATNNVASSQSPAPAVTNAVANTGSAAYVETNVPPEAQPFYNALSPYGTWVYINGEGWAWQPNIVVTDSSWQPYCDAGRWLWTDCGWYWASDYSWGWAPFHYGRWWRAPGCGWVWFPGNRWAPSWVTWRVHDDFCGWAPLPPHTAFLGAGFAFRDGFVGFTSGFGLTWDCFTFVQFPSFFRHDFRHHRLSHQRARDAFERSTVVNNFINGDNNVVINNGIAVDRVRRATGRDVRPLRVVDNQQIASGGRSSVITDKGSIVAVTRTQPMRTTTASGQQHFIAQRISSLDAIVPAVPNTLTRQTPRQRASIGRQNSIVSETRQRGLPAGRPRDLPVSPAPSFSQPANEKSLVLPSQKTSQGEIPTIPRGTTINEAAGARQLRDILPQDNRPNGFGNSERTITVPRREAQPVETFTPPPNRGSFQTQPMTSPLQTPTGPVAPTTPAAPRVTQRSREFVVPAPVVPAVRGLGPNQSFGGRSLGIPLPATPSTRESRGSDAVAREWGRKR